VQRLVIVDDGAIVVDAPAAELLAQPSVLDAHGVAVPQLAALNAALRERYRDWPSPTTVESVVDELQVRGVLNPSTSEVTTTSGPPVIELSHVTFRYPGASRPAVEDVSLRVASGEIAAVVGNNGSGKTTLSKLILGLIKIRPSSGGVTVFGEPVARIRPDVVGYIYQNPDAMLSQMSVRDEVAFTPRLLGRTDAAAISEEMLSNFGLDELATRFPLALSKGQRQRLAYAAVSASGTPILIFDEPTTGIDLPGVNQIMQYMDSLRRAQRTIVFITHDMPLAMRWADRILVMHDGRLVHTGPPSSLLQLDPEVLARYHLRLPPIADLARRLGLLGRIATPEDLLERLEAPATACIS
jgi:energy-coupling factor transport system ATP-binding protein